VDILFFKQLSLTLRWIIFIPASIAGTMEASCMYLATPELATIKVLRGKVLRESFKTGRVDGEGMGLSQVPEAGNNNCQGINGC
jgi:hypothetical protein